MSKDKILKAGKIAAEVRDYAKSLVKKDKLLIEIAEEIEKKIIKLGGKPAFPTNISINEIAAHYTPIPNDQTKAHGLIKIDFGVHVEGYISDNAFSIDLDNSDQNKNLIQAAQDALESAIETISQGKFTSEVGEAIQTAIQERGFQPIINLSGHEIKQYDLHAGLSIPNFNDHSKHEIKQGLFAIEPFATLSTASGKIQDGGPSGIYMLIDDKVPRTPLAREVLEYIIENYNSLPFCSRWLVKEFGTKALLALKQLEQNNNIHHYKQLVESTSAIVSQAEHTILLTENEKIITTKDL
jgi:methionyl aminopeptidase